MKRRMVIGFVIGALVGLSPLGLAYVGVPGRWAVGTVGLPGVYLWWCIVGVDDNFGLPWLLLNTGFYGLLGLCGGYLRAKRRRSSPRTVETCANCGYCLTGNVSGICPECGTAIGPSGKKDDTRSIVLILVFLLLVLSLFLLAFIVAQEWDLI